MSRSRGGPGLLLLPALVGAGTTWAALTAWRGFVAEPSSFLVPVAVAGIVVAVTGALLRWSGAPRPATVLLQLVVAVGMVCFHVTGSPVPYGAAGAELVEALRQAIESARTYVAPISPKAPPVAPLLIASGTAFILLVDVVACTYRRVPAAGLALLAIYSVPSGLLVGGPGWASFLAAAIGFLAMLHLDARDQLLRWGRPIGPDQRAPWGGGNPVREAMRAGAGRIGITATALALLLPAFVPVLDIDVLSFGAGSGDGDIRIRKPIADMRRDLERGVDVPLIRVSTDDPAPEYLRISVLNRFTGQEWSSGDRDVDVASRADGQLPMPTGLAESVPRTEHRYQVEITDAFNSTWLPTQFPASAVTADGDWRFDPATMDFLAADDDLDTRGMRYDMTGVTPRYGTDGAFFRDAATGSVAEEFGRLPEGGVPEIVRDLARSVTAAADNDYERALLLQRWFRRDGGFRYDLSRAPEGTGNETLSSFLSTGEDGRVGYCEQFASAMAVMARVLGIPARLAVGFLEPDQIGATRWEYSSHDLHAWPELFFAGAGWVRFEPTPAGRVERVPDYSRVPVFAPGQELPTEAPSAGGTDAGDATTAIPTRAPMVPDSEQQAEGAEADRGGLPPAVLVVLVLLGSLAAVALALVVGPRRVRVRARRTRLVGGPDEVWTELRATATDVGVPWPDGRSPREVGTVLAAHLADPVTAEEERPRTGRAAAPQAAEALDRLVLQVEQARYARRGAVATLERTTLGADATTVIAALEAGVPPRTRRRARALPRSLWRR